MDNSSFVGDNWNYSAKFVVKISREIFRNLRHFGHTDVELHLVEVIPPESYAGMNTVALSDMVYEKMIADLGESFRYSE